MDQEIRKSVRKREEDNFESHMDLFLTQFKNINMKPQQAIDDSCKYLQKNGNAESYKLLMNIFEKCKQQQSLQSSPNGRESYMNGSNINTEEINGNRNSFNNTYNVTVEHFVFILIETIKQLHLDNSQDDLDMWQDKENIIALRNMLYKFQYNEITVKQQNNLVSIFYVKDKKYQSDLFKFYQIKYKFSVDGQEPYRSVPSEDDSKKWHFQEFGTQQNQVQFKIMGKSLFHKKEQTEYNQLQQQAIKQQQQTQQLQQIQQQPSPLAKQDFVELSNITLPVKEIFLSIKPSQFGEEDMEPVYLIFSYNDKTPTSPFNDNVEVEFGFKLVMSQSERINVINKLLDFYQNEIPLLENRIKKRVEIINNLLYPFKDQIEYRVFKGLYKKKEEGRSCYADICNIF